MLDSKGRHEEQNGWNIYMEAAIETFVSDLMVHYADLAYPVSQVGWETDLLTTQKIAAALFLGRNNDQVRATDSLQGRQLALGEDNPRAVGQMIGIATEGYHRYDCDPVGTEGDRAVGDWVSFAENDAGDGLEPQKVVVVDDVDAAIGRVIEASTGTNVFIRLFGLTTSL